MRPLKRSSVNKVRSAAKFRKHGKHTKAPNLHTAPMRGGWRL